MAATLTLALEASGCNRANVVYKPRLENDFFPADLEAQIEAFVDYYSYQRYHESTNNLTPANVYFGRGLSIIKQREGTKRTTMETRRLLYRKCAA